MLLSVPIRRDKYDSTCLCKCMLLKQTVGPKSGRCTSTPWLSAGSSLALLRNCERSQCDSECIYSLEHAHVIEYVHALLLKCLVSVLQYAGQQDQWILTSCCTRMRTEPHYHTILSGMIIIIPCLLVCDALNHVVICTALEAADWAYVMVYVVDYTALVV